MQGIAKILAGCGVRANAVTFAGFAASAAAGVLAGRGMWLLAATVAMLSGVCDLLDGKIARLDPDRTKFGALWDSSLDRYSDAFLIAGIGYYFAVHSEFFVLLAALSAMAGAFEISYVRARAEGLGFECRVGFWERGERWVLILAGLLAGNPAAAVLVLAVATHATAARRILHVHATANGTLPAPPGTPAGKWARPANLLQAAAALAFVALFRWPW